MKRYMRITKKEYSVDERGVTAVEITDTVTSIGDSANSTESNINLS